MNAEYHSAPSQPRFTAHSAMQVKSERWVEFPGSSFPLKECNAKPHLDWNTGPFFCFWESGDGDSQLHAQKELPAERGSVVPVPIHFTGSRAYIPNLPSVTAPRFKISGNRRLPVQGKLTGEASLPLMMLLPGNSSPTFSIKQREHYHLSLVIDTSISSKMYL